jgi:hypothetical protein
VTAVIFAHYDGNGTLDVVVECITALMSTALSDPWLITLKGLRPHHICAFAQEVKANVSFDFFSQRAKGNRRLAGS